MPTDPWTEWVTGVLGGLGAPVNQTNVETLYAWSNAETDPFPLMRWNNPLDTTQPEGPGTVDENSVGVKAYATVEQGIRGTLDTLLNGRYPLIVDHLRRSVPRQQWADCCAELGVWGTGCGWLNTNYGLPKGVLIPDMTADQSQKLDFIYNLLIAGNLQNPPHDLLAQMQAHFATLEAEIAALKAQIAALPAPVAPASEPAEPKTVTLTLSGTGTLA